METLAPAKPRCKACGLPSWESLVSGARFGVVGNICRRCWRGEEAAERGRLRVVRLEATTSQTEDEGRIDRETRRYFLEVLDPRFAWDDLTPRAAVRAILANATTRRVFFHRSRSGERMALPAGAARCRPRLRGFTPCQLMIGGRPDD